MCGVFTPSPSEAIGTPAHQVTGGSGRGLNADGGRAAGIDSGGSAGGGAAVLATGNDMGLPLSDGGSSAAPSRRGHTSTSVWVPCAARWSGLAQACRSVFSASRIVRLRECQTDKQHRTTTAGPCRPRPRIARLRMMARTRSALHRLMLKSRHCERCSRNNGALDLGFPWSLTRGGP